MKAQEILALDAFVQELEQSLSQLPASVPVTLASTLTRLAAAMRTRTAAALASPTVTDPKPLRRLGV